MPNKQENVMRAANLTMLINTYGLHPSHAQHLQKLARSLHKSHEKECNYGLTPRQKIRERNLWIQVEAIIDKVGPGAGHDYLYVREQGDARGWPIDISKTPMDESTLYHQVCPL